jgi:hypothetical protein
MPGPKARAKHGAFGLPVDATVVGAVGRLAYQIADPSGTPSLQATGREPQRQASRAPDPRRPVDPQKRCRRAELPKHGKSAKTDRCRYHQDDTAHPLL